MDYIAHLFVFKFEKLLLDKSPLLFDAWLMMGEGERREKSSSLHYDVEFFRLKYNLISFLSCLTSVKYVTCNVS